MKEYTLTLDDGTSFNLSGISSTLVMKNTLQVIFSELPINSVVLDKASGDGAVELESRHLGKQSLTISKEFAFDNDTDCLTELRALQFAFYHTIYLVDEDESLRCKLTPSNVSITYDEGCYLRTGNIKANFIVLTPFWEDDTETEVTGTCTLKGYTDKALVLTTVGDTPFTLSVTFPAEAWLSAFQISCLDTKATLHTNDPLLGGSVETVLDIDMKEGTIEVVGSGDRSKYVSSLSGFFNLPAGSSTLQFYGNANAPGTFNASYSLKYRKRYFIC